MKESFESTQGTEMHDNVFTKIDRKSAEILSALARAPIYKKFATVKARPAILGEVIVTVMKDGSEETSNEAKEGDFVVTNPSGEQYIDTAKTFTSRYDASNEDGVYIAKGYCRVIKNPYGARIEILASWGKPQYGDEDCLIADTCNHDGAEMAGEPYIIEEQVFADTYLKVAS